MAWYLSTQDNRPVIDSASNELFFKWTVIDNINRTGIDTLDAPMNIGLTAPQDAWGAQGAQGSF
jgi:hypothetical protein